MCRSYAHKHAHIIAHPCSREVAVVGLRKDIRVHQPTVGRHGPAGNNIKQIAVRKNVPAANQGAIMVDTRAGPAVGRHAKNKFPQKTGTVLRKPTRFFESVPYRDFILHNIIDHFSRTF
jgi:hypothetical protein